MSLADRSPARGRGGQPYRVARILDTLPPEDVEILNEWLRNPEFSPEAIANELSAEGHPVSAGAVATYRSKVLGVGKRSR